MNEDTCPELLTFAAGIETASGGAILPGMGHAWTSALADQMTGYELTHRDGTGLDLDCVNVATNTVAAWARTLDCVSDVIELDGVVHVTIVPGANVDLTGAPKAPKKKKTEDAPAEAPAE